MNNALLAENLVIKNDVIVIRNDDTVIKNDVIVIRNDDTVIKNDDNDLSGQRMNSDYKFHGNRLNR